MAMQKAIGMSGEGVKIKEELETFDRGKRMNAREIVKQYLIVNGYDGLYGCDGLYKEVSCGCKINDLMPCGEVPLDCCAGYYVSKGVKEYDFMIGPGKGRAKYCKRIKCM
jgi:hypothetical protein